MKIIESAFKTKQMKLLLKYNNDLEMVFQMTNIISLISASFDEHWHHKISMNNAAKIFLAYRVE